jgi:hypothetical protein
MTDVSKTIDSTVNENFLFDSADAIEKLMSEAGADSEPLGGDGENEAEAKPEPQATEPPPAKESSPAPPPVAESKPQQEEKPAGVLTKDGKHVIPFEVVETERRRTQELKTKNEQLQAELDRIKADTAIAARKAEEDAFEVEVKLIEADMPDVAKRMRSERQARIELEKKVEALATKTAAPPPPAQPEDADQVRSSVMADMQGLPLLQKWSEKGNALWKEACALDEVLAKDPAWASKPRAERFAEVQRSIAADNGLGLPTASAPAPPPTPTPAKPVTSLSDLGGTPPAAAATAVDWETVNVHDQLSKAQSMSLEDLMRGVGVPV